jgi:predicted MFS family arabinose efflux permease
MLTLTLFGAGCGLVDVTMNVQGVMVERSTRRSLMSGFHGLFSLGTIVSAAGITFFLWLGASPLVACSVLIAGIVLFLLTAGRHALGASGEKDAPMFVRPTRQVLALGTLCLLAFLTEGSVLDWSAIFLADYRGVDHSIAGLGFAVFAVMMATGRLNGDRIVARLGSRKVLVLSGLIAIAGFAVVLTLDNWLISLAGFAVIGIGVSNIAPVYLSLAGTQRSMPGELAISIATSIGYLGILLGPALIGFAAKATSLGWALFMTALGMLVIIASAPRLFAARGA